MSKKRGRPKKTENEIWADPTPLRLDKDTLAAVEAYQSRRGFASRSEAIRQLVRVGLKVESSTPGENAVAQIKRRLLEIEEEEILKAKSNAAARLLRETPKSAS